MRKLLSVRVLVAFLLAFFASAPPIASTVSWFCDGRLCGVLLCCCEQPYLSKTDEKCKKTEAQTGASVLCAADCACIPVVTTVQNFTDTLKPAIASPPFPELCLAPTPGHLTLFLYLPIVPRCLPDYRDPPTAQPTELPSGLRAPPAS